MRPETRTVGGHTLGLFTVAVLIGGMNFIAVRYSNLDLEPLWGAALRFTIAGLVFVGIAVVLRLQWPRGRQLALMILYGLLVIAASYALLYWALTQVSAGFAAVVLAIVPLVTLLLAVVHRMERLGVRTILGSVLALAGIAWIVVGPEQRLAVPVMAVIAMLAAALSIGESVIVGKMVADNHPVMTNAVAFASGALALLAVSAIAGDRWALPSQPEAALAVLYLVTVGSVGLFVLVLLVVRKWTASATSYMFVLFPLVVMVLEAVFFTEPLTLRGVSGAVLVMAGVWFGALAPSTRRSVAPEDPRPSLETG